MRILSDDYMNRLTRPDLLVRYSRTLEALHTGAYDKFDAVFAGAAERMSAEREAKRTDSLIADTAREYSRSQENTGRDALIVETAQRFAQSVNTSGRDAVFAAYRYEQLARTHDGKRGDITCV